MDIIKYFKNVVWGLNNIFAQILLFSIIGILTISFCNIITGYTLTNYFGTPPANIFETILHFLIVIFIIAFLIGYHYTFTNAVFKEENECLPNPNREIFLTFAKMLPILLIWGVYISIFILIGIFLFKVGTLPAKIYFTILLCFLPFISAIFTVYSRRYELKYLLFKPMIIINVINKTIDSLIEVTIILLPIYAIIFYIIFKGFHYTENVSSLPLQLQIRLGLAIIVAFLVNFCVLVTNQGFVKSFKHR